jgi:hypothetical protein
VEAADIGDGESVTGEESFEGELFVELLEVLTDDLAGFLELGFCEVGVPLGLQN